MYNLDNFDFGSNLKLHCKNNNISLVELGNKIGKAKSTMYKYASNEIVPDILTIQEICNELNINVNELLNMEEVDSEENKAINPFNTNELFLYYIGFENKLLCSHIKINEQKGLQKVVFKNIVNKKDITKNAYDYVGSLETDSRVAFISLKNDKPRNQKFEKVLIIINLTYISRNFYIGSITGTTDSNRPTTRKCVISLNQSMDRDELNEIYNILCFSEQEKKSINENNVWNIETIDLKDFFVAE